MSLILFALNAGVWMQEAMSATLQFQVREKENSEGPYCNSADRDYCRDDLDLQQVFKALKSMASGAGKEIFKHSDKGSAVHVNIGPGIYRIDGTLELSNWSGNGEIGPLHVSGAGAKLTIITGTFPVSPAAWRSVPTELNLGVAANARAHVRVADLSSMRYFKVNPSRRSTGFGEPIHPVPLEVYADDVPMPMARWPNTGWAKIGALRSINSANTEFSLQNENFVAWKAETNLYATGYFSYDWAYERIPVLGVTEHDGLQYLQVAPTKFGVLQTARVAIENALIEIDSPGEWYFDAVSRSVYFWPPQSQNLKSVEVSWVPNLLRIDHSKDVTIENLGFQGSTGDAVQIFKSRNVTLADAVVRNSGNRAVVIDGGDLVAVRRTEMTDLGDGGVFIAGGDRQTLFPAKHVIENCRIERFSRLSRSYRPAIAIEGVGIQVLRNRISDGPHAAIIFSGNDHLIEGNSISDVVTETNDAGAIYTGRDWTARGTIISNNLLQNIYPRLPGTHSVKGIYLDDQASGAIILGNVFANVGKAVFVGGGRDNVIRNNIFVSSDTGIFIDNRGIDKQREQTRDPNGQLQRNLRNVPYASAAYRERYPRLAVILDDELGRSKYNVARNNLFVATRDFEFLNEAQSGLEREGNWTVPWSAFKTLRARKSIYNPHDFDLQGSELVPITDGLYPSRDGIAK